MHSVRPVPWTIGWAGGLVFGVRGIAPDGTYEDNNLLSVSSRFDERKSIEEQKVELVTKNINVPMQTAKELPSFRIQIETSKPCLIVPPGIARQTYTHVIFLIHGDLWETVLTDDLISFGMVI
jgi:hypothetical protein